jgi:hypothetical protein
LVSNDSGGAAVRFGEARLRSIRPAIRVEAIVERPSGLVGDGSLAALLEAICRMIRMRRRGSTRERAEPLGQLGLREELCGGRVRAERGHVELMSLLGVEDHLLISPQVRVLRGYGGLGRV